MARQFQYGWAAQPPVGDEQGTLRAQLRAGQVGNGLLGHNAHQVAQTAVFDA